MKRLLYFIINLPAFVILALTYTIKIYFIDIFTSRATTTFFWQWNDWASIYKQFRK